MRADAFARINEEIWRGRYSEARALAHPREFVARSHASISLALGCIGTHIGIVKERMTQQPSEERARAVRHADRGYLEVRELLDRIYLPLKRYEVHKNGPLSDPALWRRWDALIRLQASGGAQSSVLDAVLRRAHQSLGPISISDEAGTVTLSGEAKFLYADRQPNPSRIGKFWQITLTAQGGAPLTGLALQKVVHAAVKQLNAALGTDRPNIDPHQATQQVQGLLLDVSAGTSIVMKFRQAPGASAKAIDLQYIRVLNDKTSGATISVTLPTHVGTFTPGMVYSDTTQGFQGEIIGPDLSYLMMQHPKLAALLEQPDSTVPQRFGEPLDANPRVRDGYFGTSTTIVETVSRYGEFRRAKAEAAGQFAALAKKPFENEFYRYYASEPFARIARIARHVQNHAPGSTASGAEPLEALPALGEDIDIDGIDLEAASARLLTMRTIEERVDYFCQEGRPLLDAFSAIVGNTRAINAAAMFHVDARNAGFQTQLRDERALRRHNQRTEAARLGAAPATDLRARIRNAVLPMEVSIAALPLDQVEAIAAIEHKSPLRDAARTALKQRKQRLA